MNTIINKADTLSREDKIQALYSSQKHNLDKIQDKGEAIRMQHQTWDAAELLVDENPNASMELLVESMHKLYPRLKRNGIRVYFCYKKKDGDVAKEIIKKLQDWSNGNIEIMHMGDLEGRFLGQDWRSRIEQMLPECDCFIMLLPGPDDDRAWITYEAGFFASGMGLTGRLICLHHPDNDLHDIPDPLVSKQAVPATIESVEGFLKQMFKRDNWVPGKPAVNPEIEDIDEKAKEIVDMIRPAATGKHYCCGPHIEVSFASPLDIHGLNDLREGKVLESNEAAMNLFGLSFKKDKLGEWFDSANLDTSDLSWSIELSDSINAAAKGIKIPIVASAFSIRPSESTETPTYVRPRLCAVRRRRSDNSLLSVDLLFTEIKEPSLTNTLKPELGALAQTLELAWNLRFQLLEPLKGKCLKKEDLITFGLERERIYQEVMKGKQWGDAAEVERKVMSLYSQSKREKELQGLYEKGKKLWGEEVPRLLLESDAPAFQKVVIDLYDLNNQFLEITTQKLAEIFRG
jgi:hypothetical protein